MHILPRMLRPLDVQGVVGGIDFLVSDNDSFPGRSGYLADYGGIGQPLPVQFFKKFSGFGLGKADEEATRGLGIEEDLHEVVVYACMVNHGGSELLIAVSPAGNDAHAGECEGLRDERDRRG